MGDRGWLARRLVFTLFRFPLGLHGIDSFQCKHQNVVLRAHSVHSRQHFCKPLRVIGGTTGYLNPVLEMSQYTVSKFRTALINICYIHLPFNIFLAVCPYFTFKKYTGTSKFPFRALPEPDEST
jgi:hypothetical protein